MLLGIGLLTSTQAATQNQLSEATRSELKYCREQADILASEGLYAQAIEYDRQALSLLDRDLFPEQYAASLCNLGLDSTGIGDYVTAAECMEEAANLFSASRGASDVNYINSMYLLACYKATLSQHAQSVPIFEEIITSVADIYGPNSETYYNVIGDYGSALVESGRTSQGIPLLEEACEFVNKNEGRISRNYFVRLNNMIRGLYLGGKYNEGLERGVAELQSALSVTGDTDPLYNNLLVNVANCHQELGNYEQALDLLHKSLLCAEKIYGKNHPDYALTLSNMANIYAAQKNYEQAIGYGEQVLGIRLATIGRNNSDYIESLFNVGQYNYDSGNYKRCLELETEAFTLCTEILDKNHPYYGRILSTLSACNSALGHHGEAVRTGLLVLECQEKTIGCNHPDYATTLNNLSVSYGNLGDYQNAIKYAEKARDLFLDIYGTNHAYYAKALNNLSTFHSKLGQDDVASELLSQSISAKTKDGKITDYVALNNLAAQKAFCGNFDEAISFSQQAFSAVSEIHEEWHPHYLNVLNNLALYHSNNGDNKSAVRYASQIVDTRRQHYDPTDSGFIRALMTLAYFKMLDNETEEMAKAVAEATPLAANNVKSVFSSLTSLERRDYWNSNKFVFDELLKYFVEAYPCAPIVESAYDGALLSKGVLLNSEIEFDKFLADSGSPQLLTKYDELKSLRRRQMELAVQPAEQREEDLSALSKTIQDIERELIYQSKEYGNFCRNLSVNWRDVKNALTSGEVAIEFVTIPLDSTEMYAAFVLKNDMNTPAFVNVFSSDAIKKISNFEAYTDQEATSLVWGPLRPWLDDCNTIYFSPDGVLHNIGIEYFADFNSGTPLNNKFKIYRLSSTRRLALEKSDALIDKAIVYGGVVYDTELPTDGSIGSTSVKDLTPTDFREDIVQNTNMRGGVKYLKGTVSEADEVAASLSSGNFRVNKLMGIDATEESFKDLSDNPVGIIHVATHGFYWKEKRAERMARKNKILSFLSASGPTGDSEDKALSRSGVLMAGASHALSGREMHGHIEDGILTAAEVARLNLRNTNLVVLSACKSGMGEIGADGVFGLQRGFKKAGVNSLLMSLWDVDDEATKILMTDFYGNLGAGQDVREALVNAQKKVREYSHDTGEEIINFGHPQYWAAFILLDAL